MPTIKLDENIVNFIKKVKDNPRLGDGTIAGLTTLALRFFLHKHEECFTCPIQKECLATIELGRQKLAITQVNDGTADEKNDGVWVVVHNMEHNAISEFAKGYKRTAKQVAEQAIVEHLTRSPKCQSCQFYSEMKQKIKEEYGEVDLSVAAPGFKFLPIQKMK